MRLEKGTCYSVRWTDSGLSMLNDRWHDRDSCLEALEAIKGGCETIGIFLEETESWALFASTHDGNGGFRGVQWIYKPCIIQAVVMPPENVEAGNAG